MTSSSCLYDGVNEIRLAKSIFVLLIIFFTQQSFSCSVIITTEVFFEKNSAVIRKEELSGLSEWTEKVARDYPKRRTIIMVTNVDKTETDGQQLGRNRELAVRLALLNLNFTAYEVAASPKVFVWRAGELGEGSRNDVKRVELQIIPDMPPACG